MTFSEWYWAAGGWWCAAVMLVGVIGGAVLVWPFARHAGRDKERTRCEEIAAKECEQASAGMREDKRELRDACARILNAIHGIGEKKARARATITSHR